MDWLKDFWNTGENSNEILLIIIGVLIGGSLSLLGKLFIWIGKKGWDFTKRLKEIFQSKYITWKKKREYKRVIKLIEKQRMDIPSNFLLGKSREKNPELNKIFDMIEDGTLPTPSIYTLQKLISENPDKFKINFDEVKFKPPNINKPF